MLSRHVSRWRDYESYLICVCQADTFIFFRAFDGTTVRTFKVVEFRTLE